jgi:cbb3-type cytochrome oxidase maturation protein
MSVIYLLVPVALGIVALALGAYVWAARRGQFDDLKTPALRVLHEDDEPGRTGQSTARSDDSTTPGDAPPR